MVERHQIVCIWSEKFHDKLKQLTKTKKKKDSVVL